MANWSGNFRIVETFKTKPAAIKKAKKLRGKGYNVRVVVYGNGYGIWSNMR